MRVVESKSPTPFAWTKPAARHHQVTPRNAEAHLDGGALGGNQERGSLCKALTFQQERQQMVGEAGFEPATTSTQSSCTTGLCDSPKEPVI